jgi:urease accessory protein
MRRALNFAPAGTWPQPQAQGTVTLDYDQRHRRRIVLESDSGESFLLDLERAVPLGHGDGLALDDGTWIEVRAAPEALIEVTGDRDLICRAAWHLGNRHLPAELHDGRILLREDHVIAAMLTGLGAEVRAVMAPFSPEHGAYHDAPAPAEPHHHSHGDHAHHHHHGGDHGHDH